MKPGAILALLAGTLLIVLLVSRLPADVWRATQAILLVAASLALLLVAAAFVLRPARALLKAIFGSPIRVEGPLFGFPREEDAPHVARPLVVALVCFVVALAPTLLR